MTEPAKPAPATGVAIDAELKPGFRTTLIHGPSGMVFGTEAPRDNGGTGSTFSPTDLVAAALVTCALTTMNLIARREGIPFDDAKGHVEKRMTPPPRRIGELPVVFEMPIGLSKAHRERLEETARGCPVARSLHPGVLASMEFRYPD